MTYVGNPELGTPLIAAEQTIGIDLPTRYLAWEGADGAVTVAHVDINVIAERHGITGLDEVDEVLAMVETGTANFTAAAAGSTSQVGTAPSGGVAAGGGSIAWVENGGLLALGALSLFGAGALAVHNRRQPRGRPAGSTDQ